MACRSLEPREVWALLERGDARLPGLRTEVERRRYGAPPGAVSVSLARHVRSPEGEGAIYLCQHAVRSKATLRNGPAHAARRLAPSPPAPPPIPSPPYPRPPPAPLPT